MNERIKTLRKVLNLTMEAFGANIGVTKSSVSRMESGNFIPSDQTILLICHVYGVNESWLRDGVGDMFSPRSSSHVDALLRQFPMSELCAKLLYAFDSLAPDQQAAVMEYMRRFISSMVSDDPAAVAASIADPEKGALRQALSARAQQDADKSSTSSQTNETA